MSIEHQNKGDWFAVCRSARQLALLAAATMSVLATSAGASTWTGATGDWSSVVSPGWTTGGVPNGIGAVATFDGLTAGITTVNVSSLVVGSINLVGNVTGTRTVSPGLQGVALNQDGAGSGFATISNSNTNTAATRLSLSNTGTVTFADDVLVTNTSASTGSFSISITSTIVSSGTTNLTINNATSNSLTAGPIIFGAVNNSFSGTVLIQKGAVTIANPSFGGSANAITLGSAGNGSATFVTTGSNTSIANPITVAGGTGGTLLLGSTSAAASNSTFSGAITLNGNVNLLSNKQTTPTLADVRYTGVISGSGSITTVGTGRTQFGNGSTVTTNTYTGNTTLTESSSLTLSDNASLKFVIGATGVNNKITGSGQTLTLAGDFNFDLTGSADNGSWTIVDVANLSETFGSTFSVLGGFTQASDVWTFVDGLKTYTFAESTGVLTAVTVPEPASLGLATVASLAALSRRRRAR